MKCWKRWVCESWFCKNLLPWNRTNTMEFSIMIPGRQSPAAHACPALVGYGSRSYLKVRSAMTDLNWGRIRNDEESHEQSLPITVNVFAFCYRNSGLCFSLQKLHECSPRYMLWCVTVWPSHLPTAVAGLQSHVADGAHELLAIHTGTGHKRKHRGQSQHSWHLRFYLCGSIPNSTPAKITPISRIHWFNLCGKVIPLWQKNLVSVELLWDFVNSRTVRPLRFKTTAMWITTWAWEI